MADTVAIGRDSSTFLTAAVRIRILRTAETRHMANAL